MLEIRNLSKEYRTKGNVVKALDNISISFPETGMVFLLGKSGSGKSTLLNVAGGLDKATSGEIIIKGRNSCDFSAADFDSYRNAYIGFIFQEYNILNDFNVEQNISLALQLQGRPNDQVAVDALLAKVDLANLGKRKPNTLSVGQKQRVAIARALVKNPEIIMADEPTGALDSKTGKQVLDTLKKLSKDKLVLVVSHDREFAELYADRIIELSDGKIISDVTKNYIKAQEINKNISFVSDNILTIKEAEKLTRADVETIYQNLKDKKGEVIISSGEEQVSLVRRATRLNRDNSSEVFRDTEAVELKKYGKNDAKFIKSQLPMKRAFKMGMSALKSKPIKMIMACLLTTLSLIMFGVASTMMLYNESYSLNKALANSEQDYELIMKSYKKTNTYYREDLDTGTITDEGSYNDQVATRFGKQELQKMNTNDDNHLFAGVFNFNGTSDTNFNVAATLNDVTVPNNEECYFVNSLFGFIDADQNYMEQNGFSLSSGTHPSTSEEIAISQYTFNVMKKGMNTIEEESDVVGKKFNFRINGNKKISNLKLKVSGIYKLGDFPELFKDMSTGLEKNMNVKSKFVQYLINSYHVMGYVAPSFYDTHAPQFFEASSIGYVEPLPYRGLYMAENIGKNETVDQNDYYSFFYTPKVVNKNLESFIVYDLDGAVINYVAPKNNEVYVSYDTYVKETRDNYLTWLSKASFVLSNKDYDQEVYDKYKEDNSRTAVSKMIQRLTNYYYGDDSDYLDEDFDFNEDFTAIKALIDDYFVKLYNRYYTLNKGLSYKAAHQAYQKADNVEYTNFVNDLEAAVQEAPYDVTKIEAIDTYLKNRGGSDLILEHYNATCLANSYNYNNDETITSIYEKMTEDSVECNAEEYQYLLNFINNEITISTTDISELLDIGYQPGNVDDELITTTSPKLKYKNYHNVSGEMEVIGYFKTESYTSSYLVSEEFMSANAELSGDYYYVESKTTYQKPTDEKYQFAITKTEYTQNQIENLLSDFDSYNYEMTNNTYKQLTIYLMLIEALETAFLSTGVVFSIFAALMLLNFIASSISSKTKEIGILRAIGARGNDLFKIFFSEAGVVAALCAGLGIVVSALICWRLNVVMARDVGIQLLNFGILNILSIILGSLVIASIGTFLPVWRASRRSPVDSIRTL